MRPPYFAVALAFLAASTSSSAYAQIDSSATVPVVKHTVKRGDTLWDIAKYYLKDPFLWPKVFKVNTQVVKNPHWIYPGQVLSIPRSAVRDQVADQVGQNSSTVTRIQTRPSEQTTVFLAPASALLPSQYVDAGRPVAHTVRQGEYEAAPFVVDDKHPLGSGQIAGAVEPPALGLKSSAGFSIYDRLYVTPPAGTTLHRGDKLLLAKLGDVSLDVGQVIEPTGILRIDSIPLSGPVLGTVVKQFQEIHSAQITMPYEQSFHATAVRPIKGVYDVKGTVLWIKKRPPLPSIQTYLVLGVPQSAGVHPGDQFTLYDQSRQGGGVHLPPIATATVQVLRVTPLGATGVIINQQQPIVEEGMSTTLTAKMP